MNKYILIKVFAVLVIASSCSSGKKQLAKGNYEESIELAIQRLKNSPGNKRAQASLAEAYPLARDLHLKRIDWLKGSTERFKWDQIASAYDELNNVYNLIQRCPACMKVVPNAQFYGTEFNAATTSAAEERYSAGIQELAKGTREAAIVAHQHFSRVQYLKPNYKDTPAKLEEALFAATLHVLVDQIPVHSRAFGLSHEFFQNQINEFLHEQRASQYVRFYTPAEADREQMNEPDHVVVLQFDDFVVGQTYMREQTKTVTRDSVVVGTVEVDGQNVDVYNTVEAEFTTFSKYIDSGGLLDMRIYDARTDRILFQRKMPGQYQWLAEWATFQGDKRALTDEQFQMTRQTEAQSPPPQFLFEQFCRPIYGQVADNFRRYYRDY